MHSAYIYECVGPNIF